MDKPISSNPLNSQGTQQSQQPPKSQSQPLHQKKREMEPSKIQELKQFVQQCKENPSVLNDPSLSFFKSYLQSLGARISSVSKSEKHGVEDMSDTKENVDATKHSFSTDDDEHLVESDIELDDTNVVEPDNDPLQKMGNPSIEVTDKMRDTAQMEKTKAMAAILEGKLNEAIDHLTEAIMLNPTSAILYATRASVFVEPNKPNAAIRDADSALEINPDSAKGNKSRGIAKAMLGHWEEAVRDLRVASKLDHDAEIGAMLKTVEPNVRKIEEHRKKYERLRKEREKRKEECDRKRQQAAQEQDALAALKDGQIIGIHSIKEVETKLNAATKTSRLSILYFTATWCGPCRAISPVFSNLASKYPKVVFLKVDIDEAREVAAKWNISSVPTFFFVKNGKEVDKISGADKSALERKVEQYSH